jgi:hypothetical protein
MHRALAIGLLCGGLGACALPGPLGPALTGDLTADRQACNTMYPPHIGNYLPHAQCVNAVVERDAIPTARYPDLVRLQEQLRVKYSAQIDRGVISPREGERKMTQADELVNTAIRERDSGRVATADRQLGRLEAMLQ